MSSIAGSSLKFRNIFKEISGTIKVEYWVFSDLVSILSVLMLATQVLNPISYLMHCHCSILIEREMQFTCQSRHQAAGNKGKHSMPINLQKLWILDWDSWISYLWEVTPWHDGMMAKQLTLATSPSSPYLSSKLFIMVSLLSLHCCRLPPSGDGLLAQDNTYITLHLPKTFWKLLHHVNELMAGEWLQTSFVMLFTSVFVLWANAVIIISNNTMEEFNTKYQFCWLNNIWDGEWISSIWFSVRILALASYNWRQISGNLLKVWKVGNDWGALVLLFHNSQKFCKGPSFIICRFF